MDKSLSVLLADDDEFLLELLAAGLKGLGIFDVQTAINGTQVITLLEAGKEFDVIFTDLNMPEMDGVELMRNLAERRFSGNIVLLTGEHPKILQTADRLAKVHGLLLSGVLQKPVSREDLKIVLAGICKTGQPGKAVAPSVSSTTGISVEDLATALREDQIFPYFQPRIGIDGHSVVAVEALARWKHPEKGTIMPGIFIPLAEQSGLIRELSQVMLKATIQQLGRWQWEGVDLKGSINVTSEDVTDIELPDRLASLCQDAGVHPSRVVLEITESQLMQRSTLTLDTLVRLRLKGLTLAVDDFGTGYSNLGQIKRAPFSELKIDRSFVKEGVADEEGRAILKASIQLGKQLGLTVVAEGVETQEEWDAVAHCGADEVQGYLVATPMPASEVARWMVDWQHQATNLVV